MLEKKGKVFETIDEFAELLNPLNLAFSELCKAVKIAMTLPVSTAGCERTFSKLKIIKKHLIKNHNVQL
jgi:hypothetical protein